MDVVAVCGAVACCSILALPRSWPFRKHTHTRTHTNDMHLCLQPAGSGGMGQSNSSEPPPLFQPWRLTSNLLGVRNGSDDGAGAGRKRVNLFSSSTRLGGAPKA